MIPLRTLTLPNPNALVAVSRDMQVVKFAPTKKRPVLNWNYQLTGLARRVLLLVQFCSHYARQPALAFTHQLRSG